MKTYLTEEGVEVSGDGLEPLRTARKDETMTEEHWNYHTPGDPAPCKSESSLVEAEMRGGVIEIALGRYWDWKKMADRPAEEIIRWRFIERKGEDLIPADPYPTLEWDEDDTAIVPLKKPGQPWWVRDDDLVRFHRLYFFKPAAEWGQTWNNAIAFQIKRRRVSAESQVLALLSVATDDEADAIRSAARRANIKVPE